MVRRLSLLASLLLLWTPLAFGQIARSASGATPADITAARDLFRLDLGGGVVAGANGSFGGFRREINWDGVPDASSAPNSLPANFFNSTSPRGVEFSTPGTGFQVSMDGDVPADADPDQIEFDNLNPTYSAQFQAFSPERLFIPIGTNVYDVLFFVPGTATPASTSGFGAVFTDVDAAGTTLQFFDLASQSLGVFNVPASPSGGLSFLGVSGFPGTSITRVRITTGNAAPGAADGPGVDIVANDDFIYGEPQADGILVLPADVAIDKSGPSNVVTGVTFQYTLTVTNNGANTATIVTVTDTLPAGLTATNVATTQGSCVGTTAITCTVGSLAPAASATITIDTSAPAPGDFSNTATVAATEPDPVPANNTDTVRTIAAAAATAPIPTAGTWALLLLASALVCGALLRLRF